MRWKLFISLYILIYLEPKYNEEIILFLYNYIKIIRYLNEYCYGEIILYINMKKNFEKKQNKFNILLKIILNVLRKLDLLADILNYLIKYTYKNI